MNKPLVFNYATHEDAIVKIQSQADEIVRLKEENTNLKIRCRIAEEDAGQIETLKNIIDTQKRTIDKYGEIFTILNATIKDLEAKLGKESEE